MFKSKKKIILVIILIVVILALIFLSKNSKDKTEYTTVKAAIMDLKQTVDATGQVESAETIKLNFKNYGRLTKVLFNEGDKVKQGDKLAELDSKALYSQVADARARLTQAQADYEKLIAGASETDIQISENNLSQKQQTLNSTLSTLNYTKTKQQTDLLNLKTTALDVINSEITTAENALEEINNTLQDPDAEDTLSIKNRTLLVVATTNYNDNIEEISSLKIASGYLSPDSENNEIFLTLDNLKKQLNNIANSLTLIIDILENTLTSVDLTETELDTLKANIKAQQIKINTSITSVQTAKYNWTSKITYYEDQIAYYQNAIKDAENAILMAENQLALKKQPARSFEIQASKARVDQAKANLDLALANLSDAQIFAPVDGVITKKNVQVGEQTSLSTPVLEMIGKSNLQVKVNIPESDIAKIKLAQNVDMTLDAFGADKKFAGQVVMIDPAETKIQDVVYYQVKVQFNNNFEEVKPGMTANLIILIEQRNQVLVVPSRAIKSRNDEKYVEILENLKEVKEKTVTVGIKGDEGTEIISGLSVGEEVITFVKN